MLTLIRIIVLLLVCNFSYAQQYQSQQKVDYDFQATLQDKKHLLDVTGTISYLNNSSQSLDTIYFQINANAYKSKNTHFAKEMYSSKRYKMLFAKESEMGGYSNMEYHIGNQKLNYIHETENDLIVLLLNTSLNPGEKIIIDINYQLKIPSQFGSLGVKDDYFRMINWYPSPCVYDNKGWHKKPHSFRYQQYNEYGDFNLELTIRSKFLVASTGSSIKEDSMHRARIEFTKSNSNNRKTVLYHPKNNKWKTIQLKANNTNSFTWVASPDFLIDELMFNIKGLNIKANTYYFKKDEIRKTYHKKLIKSITKFSNELYILPYPKLEIIFDNDNCCNDLNSSGILFLKKTKKKKEIYSIYRALSSLWVNNILSINPYENQWLSKGLNTHIYNQLTSNHPTHSNYQEYSDRDKLGLLQRNDKSQRIESNVTFYYTNMIKGAIILDMIRAYMGKTIFDETLKSYFYKYHDKTNNINSFQNHFQSKTTKDLSKYFHHNLQSDDQMDYEIKSQQKTSYGYKVKLKNNQQLKLPTRLSAYSKVKMVYDSIIEGFDNDTLIHIHTDENNVTFLLDKNEVSLDNEPFNNSMKTSGLLKYNRKIKLYRSKRMELNLNSYINLYPILGYNKIDGVHLGFLINKVKYQKVQHWNYLIAPSYSTATSKLVGLNQLSYTWYTPTKQFQSIELGYEYKTYHFQKYYGSDTKNYIALRYQRFSPTLKLTITKPENKSIFQSITLRSINILKDKFVFSNETPTISKNNYTRYDQISHEYINISNYYPITTIATLEHHRYQDPNETTQNYLKLSSTISTKIYYSPKKKISIRLFASGFLLNSKRKTKSYNNVIAHGSISLFSQGSHDYTYDGFYIDRSNQSNDNTSNNNPLINRSQFGGFGTGIGSAYSYGYSNNFVAVLNIKMDVPFSIPHFPIDIYADLGIVSQLGNNNQTFEQNFHYTTGIEIDVWKNTIHVLLPIKSSSEISNALHEHDKYYKRIAFSIDINKLRLRNEKIKNLYLK